MICEIPSVWVIVKGSECAFAENSWLRVNHGKLDYNGNLQARSGGVDVGTFGRTTINLGVIFLFSYTFVYSKFIDAYIY